MVVVASQVLVLLHLIGFAALFGGLVVQARSPEPEVNSAMVFGAVAQLATGVAMIVLDRVTGGAVEWVQTSAKLVITLFVVLITVRNRRFLSIPRGLWTLLTGLTLVNAAIAVWWA